MSTVLMCETLSTSSSATEQIGQRIGQNLKGGEVIELVSDLGGGKTTFVHGLVRGVGSQDKVTSPTFKISNLYKSARLELWHFDFYRLNEAGLIAHELNDVLNDPAKVIVVEWGELVKRVLPEDRLTIHISNTGENSRHFDFRYTKELEYLVEGAC